MEAAKAGEGGSGTPATRNPFVSRGLAYSVVFSDVVLATVIPSNTARSGGGLLPITLEPGEWGEAGWEECLRVHRNLNKTKKSGEGIIC